MSFATHIGLVFAWGHARGRIAEEVWTDPVLADDLGRLRDGTLTGTELIDRWDGKLFDHWLTPDMRAFAWSYYQAGGNGALGRDYLTDYAGLAEGDMYLQCDEPAWRAQVFALLDTASASYSDAHQTNGQAVRNTRPAGTARPREAG